MSPTPPAHLSSWKPSPPAEQDSINRYFEISLFLMLGVAFVTLAGTGKLDLFTLVLMTAALCTRAIVLWRKASFRLAGRIVFRLTVAYIPFYFLDMFVLLRSFDSTLERVLMATIHLVFFTAVLKMFSAEQVRDYLYLAALAFAQMLAAATLTIHLSFLIYFALFLLLAIATFASFEIKRARERVAIPAAASASAGTKLAPALTGISVLICAGTVVMATVLFFVLPRSRSGYFRSLAGARERITGFSDNVALGEIGEIKRSSMVVMHVQAPGLSPADGVKWRGIGLTTFDGKRWFNRNSLSATLPGIGNFHFRRSTFHPGRGPRILRYTVILQPLSSDAIFLAPQALEVTGPFRRLWQDDTGSVYLSSNRRGLLRYFALSDIARPSANALRAASGRIPAAIKEADLQLPPTDHRVYDLARRITKGRPTAYDKAKAIESYLRQNYGYTLDLPSAMPRDPIAYFLFNMRRGHCEFFASAMTVMLRTLGIPSRLVNGFLQGSYNEISNNYTVRASDAHTWVEVYFPGYGWISFDPTPAAGRSERALFWGPLGMYWDALQTLWEEWVINYDFLHQLTLAREIEGGSRQVTSNSAMTLHRHYAQLVAIVQQATTWIVARPFLLLVLLALSSLAMWGLLFKTTIARCVREQRMLSRARRGRARPQDATLAYLRLLRVLSRRGFQKAAGQTPNEFAASISGPAGILVRDFTGIYLRARFGGASNLLPRLSALLDEIRNVPGKRSRRKYFP